MNTLSTCANPSCSAQLLPLREGKLFQFEVRSISVPCVDADGLAPESPSREVAHYWLCGRCAAEMKFVLRATAVQVVALASSELMPSANQEQSKCDYAQVSAPYEYIREVGLPAFAASHRFRSEKVADIPYL